MLSLKKVTHPRKILKRCIEIVKANIIGIIEFSGREIYSA